MSTTEASKPQSTEKYVPFKQRFTLEQRKAEFERIKKNHPNKIPVIVEKGDGSKIKEIDRHKFLVEGDTQVSYMLHTIRKRIELKPDQAIFVFVNNTLPPMTLLISQLYIEHKDEDGFLYIKYTGESTFGYYD